MSLRSLGKRFNSVVLLLGMLGFGICATPAAAQERFGNIAGTVTDTTKAAVPGATITVTNKETGAVRTAVSGADGAFRVQDLPPGRYSVTIELSGFQKASVDNVIVLLGREVSINHELQAGAITETVNVVGDTRQVDLKSVTLQHNVTAEELDRLPKSRSFQGIALTAPGVNSGEIEAGFQVHGASGAENSFVVDGVVTNSLIDGRTRQDTVFEYLQEVQVKTSGINAEYGGALGGVIAAVTKSGGNMFSGEAHYYYIGNGLSAGPIERIQLSPVDNTTVFHVQDEKQKNNRNEIGGSIGGPIVKDRLFFFGSVSPRIVRRENNYLFSNGIEPGSLTQKQTLTQAFGKVTYTTNRMVANGSVLLTPTRSSGTLAAYRGTGTNFTTSSAAQNEPFRAQGFEVNQTNAGGDVNIFLTSSSFLSVRGGYFKDDYKDTGISTVTSYTYRTTNVGAANIPAALQAPINTSNTPRTQINVFDTTSRGFFNVDYNHTFNAAGTHQLKGGAGFQRSTNNVENSYPGGYVFLFWNSIATGAQGQRDTGTYGYYQVNDLATRGKVGANIIPLYVQDTWTPTPRLTLNLGLRTENEKVPSFRPDIQKNAFEFGFKDKLAPRLGASFDVRGDGKLKVFGSWGKYFDWTKYSLSRGSYGGDIWHIFYRSLDTLDINSLNLSNMPGRDLWGSSTGFRDLRGTNFENTDKQTKPMYQISTTAGLEYEMSPTTVLTVNYIHNNLNRTIEDFSALIDGDNIYSIGNPGEGFASIYPAAFPATKDFPMPRPKRQYDAVELGLSKRFSRAWFGSANYTWSRLYGNYSGLADSDEILTPTGGVSAGTTQQSGGSIARVGSNSHSAWDTDSLLWDSHGNLDVRGLLPTDRPHVVKLYGSYSFPFGTQVGAFFYGGSGTPISTVVIDLQQEPLLVNGRGDMGRTPVLTRTDLLLSHEFGLMASKKLRLELNVINLFNQKTVLHKFNFLNKGAPAGSSFIAANAIDLSAVDLAKGYDYNALIRASADGNASFDPRYGQPDFWQTGLQGQFSVKFIF
jgi:hypothetical protein